MASRYHEVYAGLGTAIRKRSGRKPRAPSTGSKPWDKIFDADAGVYGRWFSGAECNTCFNAVDRHVAGGRADQLALIHDSAITGTVAEIHLCGAEGARSWRWPRC